MPIYEYRCRSCGHEVEALQKLTEPALTECPACHTASLAKLVSAAGFQLKGSGWYATDFRNGSKPAAAKNASGAEAKPEARPDGGAGKSETKTESTTTTATPAGGCGTSCACH